MAHFVRLDENNKVIRVHVLDNAVITDEDGNEQEQLGVEFLSNLHGGGWWKQTSYNGNFRKNYAGVNFIYDPNRDAFISSKPFDSWILNEDTCQYDPPVECPDDGNRYIWNEDTTSWDEVDMGAE